jgi:hypothetical protein
LAPRIHLPYILKATPMIKDPYDRHDVLQLAFRDAIRAVRETEIAERKRCNIPLCEEEIRVALAGAVWEDIPDEEIDEFKDILDMFCDDDTTVVRGQLS